MLHFDGCKKKVVDIFGLGWASLGEVFWDAVNLIFFCFCPTVILGYQIFFGCGSDIFFSEGIYKNSHM